MAAVAADSIAFRLARGLALALVLASAMLATAGRTDLPMLNAYVALVAAVPLAAALVVDSGLTRERLRRGQQGEDALRLALIRILFLAHFVVGLMDVGRFQWSASMPPALQAAALLVFAAALASVLWSMAANRFFVPVIRLQPERGHRVVSGGPYARVRHPGYAGMAGAASASAFAIGSWWALVPALAVAALFVARAAHEDRFLHEHLDGYADYAARVPWRLVPGLW